MKYIKFLLLSLFLITFIGAQVKDNTFSSKKGTQVSDDLIETEFYMNVKIAVLNGLLQQYYKTLIKMDSSNTLKKTIIIKDENNKNKKIEVERIKYSPTKTKVWRAKDKDNNSYIVMEKYNFIPAHYTSTTSIGTKIKRLIITYDSSGKVKKFFSIILSDNFRDELKTTTEIFDDSPVIISVDEKEKNAIYKLSQKKYSKMSASEKNTVKEYNKKMNDIKLRYSFNKKSPYNVILANVENTITNALRLKFKRTFYIKHLLCFEGLYRYTEEYQRKYNTNKDLKTIEFLKQNLN